MADDHVLWTVGWVQSPLKTREQAPRQGSEGAPDAWICVEPAFADALEGIGAGDEIVVVTWFHQANRNVRKVHPRDESTAPLAGVFATRSPDRPNPIGLHKVTVKRIEGLNLLAGPIEAIDGTPVIDIKPAISVNDS